MKECQSASNEAVSQEKAAVRSKFHRKTRKLLISAAIREIWAEFGAKTARSTKKSRKRPKKRSLSFINDRCVVNFGRADWSCNAKNWRQEGMGLHGVVTWGIECK